MRRGCLSLGTVYCDICKRQINYCERYLVVDEEEGKEVNKGKSVRYCTDCALDKGYAHYEEIKGEKILTFFPEPEIETGP